MQLVFVNLIRTFVESNVAYAGGKVHHLLLGFGADSRAAGLSWEVDNEIGQDGERGGCDSTADQGRR